MGLIVLAAIVVAVVGGCVCVVWASRGGPRWVRGVAAVTLVMGEVVRTLARSSRSSSRSGSSSGSDD
ncbi:hypothetical protein N4P33_14445 [Streptomyces sp. 15-116A]|uniref:hypothetical protein n=1 Tax=Streptomyces sp. 15-116A TaxID=2259035 RepID=UPI0021B36232|nr:hypothetical protein [Streptomyces sp. 15-116A]MCT7353367.1 hypothetical protein [Streptomyces sp. 15-116A]